MKNELDLKVGTIFVYEQIKLKVVAQINNKPSCKGCHFTNENREKLGLSTISCHTLKIPCTAFCRKDKKHIIFREINN